MNIKVKIIIGVVVLVWMSIFAAAACTPMDNIEAAEPVETSVKPSIETSPSVSIEPSITPASPSPSVKPSVKSSVKPSVKKSDRLSIEVAMMVLEDSYKGTADVKVEGKSISIIPNKTVFAYEVLQAIEGDKDKLRMWESIEKSLKETSKNIDADIMISILNPTNTDNTFLTVMDGVTVYNCVD